MSCSQKKSPSWNLENKGHDLPSSPYPSSVLIELRANVQNKLIILTNLVKGELSPKTDFSSFEHLGIIEQLYEVF